MIGADTMSSLTKEEAIIPFKKKSDVSASKTTIENEWFLRSNIPSPLQNRRCRQTLSTYCLA